MVVTKQTLSREVAAVLDLPYNLRSGKAYVIVKTMMKAMAKALLKGEDIYIDGLGVFKRVALKPTRTTVPVCHKDIGDLVTCGHPPPYRGKRKWVHVPAKTVIRFYPSKVLLRMLNDSQNPRS
jgi:nucleoid DNA-binding protein